MPSGPTNGEFHSGLGMIPENEKSQHSPNMFANTQKNSQTHQLPTRIATLPPTSDPQQMVRNLPQLEVSDENFDDVYVEFIMFCNPGIPLDTDTTELRRIFRAPPKSDGKNFNTFTLFELIRKLELKEIKTWAQLALELGVEPPDLEKGQSAQKVQQYAVRLKRWMHAMHVDAFFEYLLNKSHVYFTRVPSLDHPSSEVGRDGVAAEEDLALRALLPETRPKRGRRKAEDKDESDNGKSPSQRPRLDSPSFSEDFMMARSAFIADDGTPATAHPDFQQSFADKMAPWSATPSMPGTFRWPPPDSATPMTAYPQSAITPTNRQLWNDANEPRSAITPKIKARRRHGPAVSSAWPSNGSASSGKLRGRPPSNRSVQDGPFSTFPVNPGARDVPTISLRDNTPTATPIVADTDTPQFFPPTVSIRGNSQNQPTQTSRPSGLQLQVPQRQGGTVRLATPPPVLLVNGQDSNLHAQAPPSMEYFSPPLTHTPSHQNFVNITFRQTTSSPSSSDTDRSNIDALESHFIHSILSADWYSASGASISRCSIDEASKICKQVIKNLQAESSSTEAFLINLSALAGGPLMTRLRMTRFDEEQVYHYECAWKMRFGSAEGDFKVRANVRRVDDDDGGGGMNEGGSEGGERNEGESEGMGNWKKRYLDLQQQIRERDEKVGDLKRNIMNALVLS